MRPVFIVKLSAPSDTNGNPRSVFAVYDVATGDLIDAHDVGYRSFNAVPEAYQAAAKQAPEISVSAAEYRNTLRMGRATRERDGGSR